MGPAGGGAHSSLSECRLDRIFIPPQCSLTTAAVFLGFERKEAPHLGSYLDMFSLPPEGRNLGVRVY